MPLYSQPNLTKTANGVDLYGTGGGGGGGGGVSDVLGTPNQIGAQNVDGVITMSLSAPAPAPTAGAYASPSSVTVDGLGRVTAIVAGGGGGGGVTSVAGTANQISASASTGAVSLSLPSALIAPGTLQAIGALSGLNFFTNSYVFTAPNDTSTVEIPFSTTPGNGMNFSFPQTGFLFLQQLNTSGGSPSVTGIYGYGVSPYGTSNQYQYLNVGTGNGTTPRQGILGNASDGAFINFKNLGNTAQPQVIFPQNAITLGGKTYRLTQVSLVSPTTNT